MPGLIRQWCCIPRCIQLLFRLVRPLQRTVRRNAARTLPLAEGVLRIFWLRVMDPAFLLTAYALELQSH